MDSSAAMMAYANGTLTSRSRFLEGGIVKIEPRTHWEKRKISTFNVMPLRTPPQTGGPDYYFPWVGGGVGWVKVPYEAPRGTIVITDGMNGCALQINRSGNDLYFYHDANSCSMGKIGVRPVGTEIFRVTTTEMVNIDLVDKEAERESPTGDSDKERMNKLRWCIQLICVRNLKGSWCVIRCPIMYVTKKLKDVANQGTVAVPVRQFTSIKRPGPEPLKHPHFLGKLPEN